VNRFSRSAVGAAWGDPEPEPYAWTCGAWRVEVRGDEIADIRYAGRAVLRSVRGVVRDQDWETVPATARETTTMDDGLDMSLDLVGLGADIDARLGLRATTDTLSVTFHASVRKPFRRSRVGLVVLHAADLAGRPLAVTSPSRERTETRFPTDLAPEQPAVDIAGLAWSSGGLATELVFTGDVFEMEDQRNWTDASFKTYSTPLWLPFPVLVEAGHEVHQTVVIRCTRVAEVSLTDTGRRSGRPCATASERGDRKPSSTAVRAQLHRAEPVPRPAAGRSAGAELQPDAADAREGTGPARRVGRDAAAGHRERRRAGERPTRARRTGDAPAAVPHRRRVAARP
jgi:hypothetical protein